MTEGTGKAAERRKAGARRQADIAQLWFRGYNKEEIVEKTGLPVRQVSEDLKIIRASLHPATVKTVEYYRNKSRTRLDMIRKRAWEFVEGTDFAKEGTRVAALRLVKDVEDLQTKVDGIVTDKAPAGPERRAEELAKKLVAIAENKDKGNGHDEKEDKVVESELTSDKRTEEANP